MAGGRSRGPGGLVAGSRSPTFGARSSTSGWCRASPSTASTAVVAVALPLPGDDSPGRAHAPGRSTPCVAVTGVDRVEVDLRDMDDDEIRPSPTSSRACTPNPLQVVDAAAPPRPPTARQPVHRHPHPRAGDLVGQGRRRASRRSPPISSIALGQRGPPGRRGRRRRVGLLDAAHARDRRAAGPDRRRDRAARGPRRAAHLDGVLRAARTRP